MPPKQGSRGNKKVVRKRKEEEEIAAAKPPAKKQRKEAPANEKQPAIVKGKRKGRGTAKAEQANKKSLKAEQKTQPKKRLNQRVNGGESSSSGQGASLAGATKQRRTKKAVVEEKDKNTPSVPPPPPPSKKKKVAQKPDLNETVILTPEPTVTHPSHPHTPGQVMVMGQGDVGQLGLGEEVMERKRPFPVSGELKGENLVQVVCGGMHCVALTEDGKVFTWGCNDEGALGRKIEEGEEFTPGLVDSLARTKVVLVSAGDSHTAALAETGKVYCWGVFRDSCGPFGLVHSSSSPFPELVYSSSFNKAVKVVSGADHVCILTEQGDVYTFGCGEQGQLGRIPECFSSRGGRRGIGMLLTPQMVHFRKSGRKRTLIRDIFCGAYHTFAVSRNTREVYGWGLNNFHQLGAEDSVTRYQPHKLPESWLPGSGERKEEEEMKMNVTGGEHHTVMCCDGAVLVMGRMEYGRLGLGENAEEPDKPCVVPGLEGVDTVASGGSCSFAVTNKGAAYSWGMGTNLQLGSGDEEDRWVPIRVTGKQLEGRRVIGVSAGGQHTALLVAKETEPTS